jgi:hypothetical protein
LIHSVHHNPRRRWRHAVGKSHHEDDRDRDELPYESFLNKMKESYAVVLLSLGDISPNMILDAIRLNKPFVCTKENGLMDRIAGVGVTSRTRYKER